jgi:hypothetical protein
MREWSSARALAAIRNTAAAAIITLIMAVYPLSHFAQGTTIALRYSVHTLDPAHRPQGAFLVETHESTIAGNVCRQNGGKRR